MEKRKHRPFRIILRLLAVLLALLLCTVIVLSVIPLTERADSTPVNGSADWMALLPDDLPLNRIVLPGTHDSATQYVQLAFFSKCQSLDIGQQLEAGYRYLDIRLGTEEASGRLMLVHGFTKCRTGVFGGTLYLDRVLEQCYAFLEAHPTETVVFAAKIERGDDSVGAFEAKLNDAVTQNPDRWLLTDAIPALGDARGRLVLLRRYDDEACLGAAAGIPFRWAGQKGYGDTSPNTVSQDCGGFTLWVQDRYEYGTEDKWNAFLAGLDGAGKGDDELAVHFLSTKGTAVFGHPYRFAGALNPRLAALDADSLNGWIVVDFASPALAGHIYAANFQE